MTTYYVDGTSGNDGNAGTSVGAAKATLNGAEDIPLVAGDTVHVRAGTYRELLTVDVSGSAGNPISYIGDYSGSIFASGGVVRVTGSADDVAETRANCITATSKNYRTFRGFTFDLASTVCVSLATSCSNWVIEECYFGANTVSGLTIAGTGTANTVRRCYFMARPLGGPACLTISHSATVNNAAHAVENCIFLGGTNAILVTRIGGVTVRNCLVLFSERSIRVGTSLAGGQTVTVNNCVIAFAGTAALQATATGEIIEDYNALFANAAHRTLVSAGANSNNHPPLLDTRWFFEAVAGGDMVSPFDLASYSPLVNLAGSSPPSTDLRGTSVQGAQREWGPLEMDPALAVAAGEGGGGMGSIFGGIVR